MKIETDLSTIERLTRENEQANWEFRCFMKILEIPAEKLDAIVHRLNKEVSAQIDCRACANCCKVVSPVLDQKDIKRLAKHLDMPRESFIGEYLMEDPEDGEIIFKSMPCPFLSDNLCSVYSHRPKVCRSYPHLQKDRFIFRVNQAYSNCSVCPIVFNVYEQLKKELIDEYDDFFDGEEDWF